MTDKKYYLYLNEDQYDKECELGLNTNPEYFCCVDEEHLYGYSDPRAYSYIAEITIPDNAELFVDPDEGEFKAETIIIEKIYSLKDWIKLKGHDAIEKWLDNGGMWILDYVDDHSFLEDHPKLPIWLEQAAISGGALDCLDVIGLPDDHYRKYFYNSHVCRKAWEINNSILRQLPDEYITKDMCIKTIKTTGISLNDLTFSDGIFVDEEVCRAAISINIANLEYIPGSMETLEMYEFGIKRDIRGLLYIPDEYVSEIQKIVDSRIHFYGALGGLSARSLLDIVWKFRTEKVCMRAVTQNGTDLQYVPSKLRTRELCLCAISQNCDAIHYIPKKMLDFDFYLDAVAKNRHVLKYVPDDLKNQELCLEAVNHCGPALEYVPEALLTRGLCLDAIRNDPRSLNYLSDELKKKVGVSELPELPKC